MSVTEEIQAAARAIRRQQNADATFHQATAALLDHIALVTPASVIESQASPVVRYALLVARAYADPGADQTCASPNRAGTPCVLAPSHPGDHADADGQTWFNYGPVQRYEITWMSGHIETVLAHQVMYPHAGMALVGEMFGTAREAGAPRIRMHAEIDGQWVLTLSAREEDIRTMRLVTDGEPIPGGDRS